MFDEILSRIGSAFNRYDIPYMIIGGQAVLLYGEPRGSPSAQPLSRLEKNPSPRGNR